MGLPFTYREPLVDAERKIGNNYNIWTCQDKQTNNLVRPRAAIRGHYLGAQLTFIQRNKREGRKGQTNKNDHYSKKRKSESAENSFQMKGSLAFSYVVHNLVLFY